MKVFWDYGEAHHFKGPHDGIGGTIKKKSLQPSETVSTDQAVDHGLIEILYDSVLISQWVNVLYEGEMFLGKVLNKQNNTVLVCCLSKPFGITEPQDFERENDVVYCNHVYHTKVTPLANPVVF